MGTLSGLVGSVTTPETALIMASTMASIIGDPAATNGQPSSLSLQVQTQAVDVSQVRTVGPSILYTVHKVTKSRGVTSRRSLQYYVSFIKIII
jgi:hypothetical protein